MNNNFKKNHNKWKIILEHNMKYKLKIIKNIKQIKLIHLVNKLNILRIKMHIKLNN